VSDLENSTTIRIGDLLERAGLVTSADLTEAVSVSKRLQLPIGRVLIMSGCVTERILKSAIEAQSLIRDRGVNLAKALETLVKVAEEDISFQDALRKTDPARVPGSSTNRLGEILIEFELINDKQLKEALVISAESGMQLGATLISMDLLSPMLLPLLLRTQEQIREGVITRQQAAAEFKSSYAMWTKAEESFRETGSGTDLQTQFAQAMQQRVQDPHEAFFKQFGHPAPMPPGQYQMPMPPGPYGPPPGYPPLPPGYPPYPTNQQGYPNYPYPNQYPPGPWQGVNPEQMPPPQAPNPYGAPPNQWPPTQYQHPNSQVPPPAPQMQPASGGYSVPPAQFPPQYPPQPPAQAPGAPGGEQHQHQQQWQSPPAHPGPMPPFPQQSPPPPAPSEPAEAIPARNAHPESRTANTRLPALNPHALPGQAPPAQPAAEPHQAAASQTYPATSVPEFTQAPVHAEHQNYAPAQAQPPSLPQQRQPRAEAAPIPAFERVISRKLKSQTTEAPANPEIETPSASKARRRPAAKPIEAAEALPPKSTGETTVRLTETEIEQFLTIVDHTPDTTGSAAPPSPALSSSDFATLPASEVGLTETLEAFSRSVELDLDAPMKDAVKTHEIDAVPSSQYHIRPITEVDTVIDYDALPHNAVEQTIETAEIYDSAALDERDTEEDTLIDYEPVRTVEIALDPTPTVTASPEAGAPVVYPSETVAADQNAVAATSESAQDKDDSLESEIDTLIDYEPNPSKAHQDKLSPGGIPGGAPEQSSDTVKADAEDVTADQSGTEDSMSDVMAELRAVQEQLESALDFTPQAYDEGITTKYSSFEFDFPTPSFAHPTSEQAQPSSEQPSEAGRKTNQHDADQDTPTISELPVMNFRLGNTLTDAPDDIDPNEANVASGLDAHQYAAGANEQTTENALDKSKEDEPPSQKDAEGSDLLSLFTAVVKSQDLKKHSRLAPLSSKNWGNGHEKPRGNGFEKVDKKRGKSKAKSERLKYVVEEPVDVMSTLQGVRIANRSREMDIETRKVVKAAEKKERKKATGKRKREEESQPLVDILKLAGFFSQKELDDAFSAALTNTSALPELLSIIGVIGEDTLRNITRCQAMLTSGHLKPKQAIDLLAAIKNGKTFDEAMDEHHITSTAGI
jgi:hypothetical protein